MAGWVPRALSPLSLSPPQPTWDEIILQGSSEDDSPTVRVAKRKRREALGQEYLRGRPPLLLTAGLRGRFDDKWNNPWTKVRSEAPPPEGGDRQVARASKSAERSLGSHHFAKVPDKVAPNRIDNGRLLQERPARATSRYIRPRSSRSNVSSSAASEAEDEEEKKMQNVRPHRKVKTVLERDNHCWAGLRGTSRGGARRQVDRISEPLAGNKYRNVRDGKAYKKSLRQSDSPSSARHTERPTGQYVSPVSDQSASSGSENDLQQPVIRRRKSPAERLADAIESASRIKHKGLREQTLAFCEGTRKDADRKRAMSPFPDISIQERSKSSHLGKRSWDYSTGPRVEPYARKRAALSEEGGQVSDGDTAKRRKMASVEQQQTERPKGHSMIPERHIPNGPGVSDPPNKVNIPIDFFVQPLQEMLAVASEAHRWKERLGSLTAEALATMPENERNRLFGSILSLTSIAPNVAHDGTSPRAVGKDLDVLSVQEDPVLETVSRTDLPKLPAIEDRVTNTKLSTMDPPLSPIEEKRSGQAGNKPGTNASSKSASSNTGNGGRTRGGKPLKHLSFTGSGEVKIQVRRSQEDVTDPSSNKPLSTSNLPEAQVVSNQPVLNTHLTSGSTNLLETDKPLVDDFDAEFSTQAALAKAQRSFQSDLIAHQGRPVNSQPTSVAREGPISPSKHGGRDTRSSPVKDSFGEHTEDSPLNTQDMVNAWTPFAVTTVKKPAQRQYAEASPLELKATMSKIPGPEDRQFAKPEPRSRSSLSHKLQPSDFAADHADDKNSPNDKQAKTPHGSKSSVFTESKLATPPSDDSPPMRISTDRYTKAFDTSKLAKTPTRPSHSQPSEARSVDPHPHNQSSSQPHAMTNYPGQASDSNAPPSKSQLSSSKFPASLINFPSSVSAGTTAQQDGQRQSVIDRGLEEAENFLGTWDIESQLRSAGLANTNSASKFGNPKGGRVSQRKSQRLGKENASSQNKR